MELLLSMLDGCKRNSVRQKEIGKYEEGGREVHVSPSYISILPFP